MNNKGPNIKRINAFHFRGLTRQIFLHHTCDEYMKKCLSLECYQCFEGIDRTVQMYTMIQNIQNSINRNNQNALDAIKQLLLGIKIQVNFYNVRRQCHMIFLSYQNENERRNNLGRIRRSFQLQVIIMCNKSVTRRQLWYNSC